MEDIKEDPPEVNGIAICKVNKVRKTIPQIL